MTLPWSFATGDVRMPGITQATMPLIVGEGLSIAVWMSVGIVAEAFFRRLRHFPAIAACWLVLAYARAFVKGLALWSLPLESWRLEEALRTTAFPLAVAIIMLLYLRFSRRVRNTFNRQCPSSPGGGAMRVLQDGPKAWGHGVWAMVGVLVFVMLTHVDNSREFLAASFPSPVASGHPLLTLLADQEMHFAPIARIHLLLHASGLASALCAISMFFRRSRWFFLTALATVLLDLASAILGWYVPDPRPCLDCMPKGDAIDFEIAQTLLAIMLMLLPALRKRFNAATP